MSKTLKEHITLSELHPGKVLDFIWDHAVEGMAFVGTDGQFLNVNPVLCEWLGYAPTELENMTFMDVTDPADTKADLEAVDEVLRGVRQAYTMTKKYRPKAGAPFNAKLTVLPWKDEGGKTVLFFYSQIQKLDIVQLQPKDELRVLWDFITRYKRSTALVVIGIAMAGEGVIRWASKVAETAMSIGASP